MCMGGGSVPQDNSAQIAQQQEAQRQATISQELASIKSAFDGTTSGTNPVSSYTPGQTYYNADGTAYAAPDQSAADAAYLAQFNLTPPQQAQYQKYAGNSTAQQNYLISLGKGTPKTSNIAAAHIGPIGSVQKNNPNDPANFTLPQEQSLSDYDASQANALAAKGGLYGGTTTSPGAFGDDYYNNIQQNYENYYNPQLDQQYQNSLNSLTEQLGQQGILNSSEGNRQLALLKQTDATNKQTIANNALSAVNMAKQNVATQKNALIQDAQTGADPNSLAEQTQSTIAGTQSSPTYSPLGSVFAGILGQGTNALSIQQGGTATVPGSSYGSYVYPGSSSSSSNVVH